MNDKFKEWAAKLIHISENNVYGHTANGRDSSIETINQVVNFLQSLADMPDEPEAQPEVLPENYQLVTKQYADWHIKNGMKWQMQVNALEEKLAAKDERIDQLEHSLLDKMTAENQAMGLYDQPKRPILADQPEVFNALLMALDCRYAKSTQTRPDIAREAMQCIRELLEGP